MCSPHLASFSLPPVFPFHGHFIFLPKYEQSHCNQILLRQDLETALLKCFSGLQLLLLYHLSSFLAIQKLLLFLSPEEELALGREAPSHA